MDSEMKEVRFDLYCCECKHRSIFGGDEPCNSCLETGMREGTEEPENFEHR